MFGFATSPNLKLQATALGSALMLMFFLLPLKIFAPVENLYIELIGESGIRAGFFDSTQFQKIKTEKFDFQPDSLLFHEKLLFQKTNSDTFVTLYYFHAMWGNQPNYHRKNLKRLSEVAGVNRIVSVLWHADQMGYLANWEKSYETGRHFSPLFQEIFQQQKGKKVILCHSMGHRVFEGIVSGFQSDSLLFDDVIFAAADLDTNVFEKNLSRLPKISGEIHLFIHKNDRLLKASKFMHKRDRLGLNGAENSEGLSINIRQIDVTNAPRDKALSFSNHIYFVRNQSVYSDIARIISGGNAGK
jgi:hypothetical protein